MKVIWKVDSKVGYGPALIEPEVHKDDRGYFFESFKEEEFKEKVAKVNFVQDNQSKSDYGTLRGMHCQVGDYAQAKLVSVVKGAVVDVIVDARRDSENYGKVYYAYLSEENHRQLFVPRGFLHGFLALRDNTIFQYKCDNYYSREHEASANWEDIDFNWLYYIRKEDIKLSYKDTFAPHFDKTKEIKVYYY